MTQTHTYTAQAQTGIKCRRERDSRCSRTEANLNLNSQVFVFVFRRFRVRGHETILLCGIQPLEGCGNYTQILYSCRQRRRVSRGWCADCWTEERCRLMFIMQAQGLFCEAGNQLYVLFRRTNDMATRRTCGYCYESKPQQCLSVRRISHFPTLQAPRPPSPAPLGFSRLQRVNNKMIRQGRQAGRQRQLHTETLDKKRRANCGRL